MWLLQNCETQHAIRGGCVAAAAAHLLASLGFCDGNDAAVLSQSRHKVKMEFGVMMPKERSGS